MPIIKQILPIVEGTNKLEEFSHKLIATLVLSILFSVVTYYLVEVPAARFKKYSSKSQ